MEVPGAVLEPASISHAEPYVPRGRGRKAWFNELTDGIRRATALGASGFEMVRIMKPWQQKVYRDYMTAVLQTQPGIMFAFVQTREMIRVRIMVNGDRIMQGIRAELLRLATDVLSHKPAEPTQDPAPGEKKDPAPAN